MQIEEEQPSTKSIESLLENPNNRTKVIKMMIQSMRLMGWHASARQLSLESSINSDEESIQQIKQHLKNFQYSKASQQIEKVDLPIVIKTEIQETLQDLQVMYLIKNKNYDQAIQKLGNFNNEKQVKFYTMIGLGFQQANNLQFQTKHANIIQKCLKDTVQMSCLHKMLTNYINNDRFTNRKITIKAPPKTRVAKSPVLSNLLGKVTFVKFNKDASLIAVVDDKYREIELSLWNIVDNAVTKINSARIETLGFIDAVKWNESLSHEKNSLLALCTYRNSNIVIHNTPNLEQLYMISAKNYNIPKILCFQWHPISELLYIGGLFDCSYGFDATGELITTITPFPKSREIVFSQDGNMLAISATRGQLIKFCMETEKQLNKFVATYSFMDLKYQPNSNIVIVSNKEHIYLLDANTFQVKNTFDSPLNPKMFKIQIFLFDTWTIVFNGKLCAIVQNDKVTRHANWTDYDAVDVKNNRLITFKSMIEVWQSRQGQGEQIKQMNQQMELNEEGGSIIQVEDFQIASDSEQIVQESIEQINQQIINLDDNQEEDSEFDDDDM